MVESEKVQCGGVYVIPSYENSLCKYSLRINFTNYMISNFIQIPTVWFGVIFPRSGLYKDGVFRFNISLPDKFPEDKNPPAVLFQTDIFHPLICPYTGSLDISQAFPHWKTGDDHIWQLIKYISNIFVQPWESLKSGKNLNQDAADLIRQNRAEFIAKVKQCVTISIERKYDPSPTEDPHFIVFEQFNEELHGPVLEKMKSELNTLNSTPPNSGLSWVKEGEFKPLSKD